MSSSFTVGYLRSLPQKVKSLREQATKLTAKAQKMVDWLEKVDRSKLNDLNLTGDLKLDVALQLSMRAGGDHPGQYTLETFPVVLEKLNRLDEEFSNWRDGGLVLVDLTVPGSDLFIEFVVLEVPALPKLQIKKTSGHFRDIPISIRVPGRLLLATSSDTCVMSDGLERCIDFPAKYTLSKDQTTIRIVKSSRLMEAPTSTFDLTQLFYPNNWKMTEGSVYLGKSAIVKHVAEWRARVTEYPTINQDEKEEALQFLKKFLRILRDLARVTA